MGMTLEEAIKHYEELAEENKNDAEQFKRIKATQDMISHCYECAEEHRQLAEWLRELKALHDAMDIIKCLMIAYERGKNDTLSLIEQYILEEVNADE